MKPTTALVVLVIFVLFVIGACSGSDEPERAEERGSSQMSSPSGDASPSPDGCLEVDRAKVRLIAERETADGPMKLGRAVAVRSPDFEKVFFIAIEFELSGVPGPTQAVWASNTLSVSGDILAVDNVAQTLTDWIAAESTDAEISPADRSVDTALACLGA